MTLHFVVPDPEATISGGNVYNRNLLAALRAAGADVRVVAPDSRGARDAAAAGACLVDSLYLDAVPRFRPCHLLAHYLPCLVDGSEQPSPEERAALEAATGFVVPSGFMADALGRLAPSPRPALVVAPGIDVAHDPVPRAARAVMVANLVPGKGVAPFLRALRGRDLALTIVGRLDADPAYAAECRAAAPAVELVGPRPHRETLAMIAASDLLVSSSRMEAFGLALAEARALGVPIVARAGGNVASLVDEASGGRVLPDEEALADECVRLARDRPELERRRAAARARRPPARTWADAARDLVVGLQRLSPDRPMPPGT